MWVKVCGIKTREDARKVIPFQPDAVGLNFHPRSPRHVGLEGASTIISELPESIEPIGVFVNHPAAEMRRIATALGLRTIQLHGDEAPESVAELGDFQVIRAFRVDESGLGEVEETLARLERLGVKLRACLIDAKVAGAYGGTGHTAPWELLRNEWQQHWPPMILAGGLKPENVAAAIATGHPWGVDVASGVESAPGVKDAQAVMNFVAEVRKLVGRS